MKVFLSNQLTELAEVLRQNLLEGMDDPLDKRWVIVPNEDVKLDLYLRWLKKSEVITGIKTITYCELIRKMFPELPSKMELALRIETALDSIDELKNYLDNHLRKLDLSNELSSLFLKYLQKPTGKLVQWLENEGWQQQLWKKVFGKKLPTATVRPLDGSFYFYHISNIAPYQWEAFSEMDTSWFLFSPTQMYMGDLISERKQQFYLRNVKGSAKEDLLSLFQQDSPLLSNWSEHGRELLKHFEDAETFEHFIEPDQSTALSRLQYEWFTLQKENASPDHSLQLHSAPTLLREVEVVWEIIQRLPFSPREILVLAPDIQPYAASIEWIFKQRGGPFDYSISGLEARTHSPLLQGLELLISLPAHRFSREIFKKLLLCPPFLKRFQLTIEDAETIDEWMTEVHLRYDLSGHAGSWHSALKRIIDAVAISRSSVSLDFSDSPLINRWIEITLKLEKMLTPITDQEKRAAHEWAGLLNEWIETFFNSDEETDILSSLLATLRSERIEGLFPYETVQQLLKSAFENPSGSMHRSTPETVRFTSLREGSVQSAKAIICMGMQEGSFPRIDPPSSLPSIQVSNRIVEDRYHFLEAVAHAQEMLILTYQRCHPEDGKEMQPSPLIDELIKDRGGITTTHHPISALDSFYYRPEGFRSFSTLHYNLLHSKKTPVLPGALTANLKKIIEVRILRKLARHPVQCFLEEGLGLRFPWKEDNSEFLFSPLEMHRLRKAALHLTTEELIDQLSSQGKLPTGSFKAAALQSIEKEIGAYRNALSALEIDPASVFSLELTPHAKSIQQISNQLVVAPPLQIGGIQLQGIIEGVTHKGLLFHGEESTEDLLKIWPLYLTVQAVLGNSQLLLTKKEEAAKISIPNPLEALERYTNYLQKSLQTPSPLLPAWGRRIFKGGDLPASTEDEMIVWAEKRNLLPPSDQWISEWRPYLQEALRELV
jgi:exonuclease V gamma subunit